jgi:hypothetical protein
VFLIYSTNRIFYKIQKQKKKQKQKQKKKQTNKQKKQQKTKTLRNVTQRVSSQLNKQLESGICNSSKVQIYRLYKYQFERKNTLNIYIFFFFFFWFWFWFLFLFFCCFLGGFFFYAFRLSGFRKELKNCSENGGLWGIFRVCFKQFLSSIDKNSWTLNNKSVKNHEITSQKRNYSCIFDMLLSNMCLVVSLCRLVVQNWSSTCKMLLPTLFIRGLVEYLTRIEYMWQYRSQPLLTS